MALALVLQALAPATVLAEAGAGRGVTDGPVRHSPTVELVTPGAQTAYRLGEPVALRARASDTDGQLPDEAIRWTVVRRTGGERTTVLEAAGAEAAFTPSDRHGVGTSYEVTASAVDPNGPAASESVVIGPQTVRVTLASDAPGARIAFGDGPAAGPRRFEEAVGLRAPLSAEETAAGAQLVFDGWEDGGERIREVVVPAADVTWTARYRAPAIGIGEPAAIGVGGAPGLAESAGRGRPRPRLTFDTPNRRGPRALGGTLRDAPRGARVQVAVRRGGPRSGCSWWLSAARRFTRRSVRACERPRWIRATVGRDGAQVRWRAALGRRLPAGTYAFPVRVLDAAGRPLGVRRG